METICRIIKPYKCPDCGQETVFFLTKNNMIIDYKSLINKKKLSRAQIIDLLIKNRVITMKCINCNKQFIIDISNHKYPEATDLDKCLQKMGIM